MKKAITLILAAILVLSLAACGGSVKTVNRDLDIRGITIGSSREEVLELEKDSTALHSDDNGARLQYELKRFLGITTTDVQYSFDDDDKVILIVIHFGERASTNDIYSAMREEYGVFDVGYYRDSSVGSSTYDIARIWFDRDGNYFDLYFYNIGLGQIPATTPGNQGFFHLALRDSTQQNNSMGRFQDYTNKKMYIRMDPPSS